MNELVTSHLPTSISPVGWVGVGGSVVMTLDCESSQRVTRHPSPLESRSQGAEGHGPWG